MNGAIHEQVSQIFTALSHTTRLRIIELLCTEEKTVNEVASALRLSQSSASQHLAVLARAGLLAVEQHGVSRIYRIRGPRIQRILDLVSEFCEAHEIQGHLEEVEDAAKGLTA